MTIAHLLQDFGIYLGREAEPIFSDATLEEHQLEAFEQGYQAGWDDSARAHAEDSARVSDELAAKLQQLSFTFVDAQSQVLNSLRPLFQQVSETLLPEMARATLPHLVAEELSKLAANHNDQNLTITVSDADRESLEAIARSFGTYAVNFKTNPAFKQGQVEIGSGLEEKSIDLVQVVAEIVEALAAFGNEVEKRTTHG